MAHTPTFGLAAVATTTLLAACVNLTQPPWGQANDAGDTGGGAVAARGGSGGAVVVGPDAANGGSGGGVATSGTTTGGAATAGTVGAPTTGGAGGLPATGGTTDVAMGGASGSPATGGTTEELTGESGGLPATGGTTGGTSGTPMGGATGNVALDAGPVTGASGDGGIDVPSPADANQPVDQATGGTGGARTGGTGGTAAGGTGGTVVVDAGPVADTTSPRDGGIDVPSDIGTGGSGGAGTGGTGGSGTGGTGGTGGTVGTSGAGGTSGTGVVDAGPVAGATSPRDGGIDVPSDIGTGGSGGAGTGGTGGSGTGGTVMDAAIAPMIISIDFVGGVPVGDSGVTETVVMAASESAGVKPATHWNSAASNTGTLSSLVSADGTTTSASVAWDSPVASGETSATWSLSWTDAPGDVRMMNGYLDPRATASPATIDVTLPSSMSGGYDVYVYCYGNIVGVKNRTYQYTIGTTAHSFTQQGPSATTFPGYMEAPEGGTGNYDYVVFQNLTGTTFTLTATPLSSTSGSVRAPVNGIQIVSPSGS
ncbi:MAG: hypothetical protein ABSF35_22495 [Polyangia bacterium]